MGRIWRLRQAPPILFLRRPGGCGYRKGKIITDIESGETAETLLGGEIPGVGAGGTDLPADTKTLDVGGKTALLMELSSGQVLLKKNPHEKLPIASVTKNYDPAFDNGSG